MPISSGMDELSPEASNPPQKPVESGCDLAVAARKFNVVSLLAHLIPARALKYFLN